MRAMTEHCTSRIIAHYNMIEPERRRTISTLCVLGPAYSTRSGEEKIAVPEARYPTLAALLASVRDCRACEAHLPLGPRPVLRAGEMARILIVGQAPGARVHATGIPWDDLSGERLRAWMGVDKETFHDESRVAIIPMGYCYPGRGSGGDLPPRRECAALWLDQLLARLPRIELTLLIGQYAQRHFLGNRRKPSLPETPKDWRAYAPHFIPLPHPSPRNQPWLKQHPWFERQLVPVLPARIKALSAR